MYFKRIELHGFKSFAEPTVIEFDRGITCVVGPNGSGKSNICDAIRWVLGAQSAKALRGDKMEDVIFSGTTSRKSRGMAEVTLVIDNEDGALPIDYNEVAITRRMYRSGESEYLINNTRCRMKDIRELIMDTGIGVEGYSIIGQGKISDIISNNTESIREILEETAGIVMYRTRKAEAERKLASATDNMDRVNDIIGEIEGRIDGLREDSEKAKEYLKLRDRHRELEINITLRNIENIQEKSTAIALDLQDLDTKIEETAGRKDALNTALIGANADRERLDSDIEEKRAEEMALTEEINALVNRRQVDQERRRALEENQERLTGEIADLSERIEREEENAAALEEERKAVAEGVEQLQKILEDAVAVYAEKNAVATRKLASIDEKKNEVFGLQAAISSKEAEILSIENLKETLARRKEAVLAEHAEADGGAKDTRSSLEEVRADKDALQERIAEAGDALKESRGKREEHLSEQKDLERRIEELRLVVSEDSARQKTLEEMDSSFEGYSNAVKFIMQSGQEGLDGTVADLIMVPSKLATAVETALGNAVQNVVCENDEAAKGSIRRLKEAGAGRLTFLPVESIKARPVINDDVAKTADGFVSYGVDAIRFAPRYQTIMEYLLGNVIIMEDMDTAVALSKKMTRSAKLVTLEGEIISGAGAITGGRGKGKAVGLLERKAEISALEEKIEKDKKDLNITEMELDNLIQTMRQEEDALADAEGELSSLKMELYAKDAELSLLEGALSDLSSGAERREKELADIAAEQENSDRMIERRMKEIEESVGQKAQLEKLIEEETEAYDALRDEVRAESEGITEARIQVTNKEGERDKIEAVADRIKETIAQLGREKRTREEQLAEHSSEMDSLAPGAEEEGDPVAEREEAKSKVTQALDSLRAEKQALVARMEEDTAAREELDTELSALQSQKYELEIKNARQETQLENAKNKLWEEFEVSLLQALELKSDEFVMTNAVKENREIKARLRELGEVNVGAIQEYEQVSERYEFLTGQREDIVTSMNELTGIIRDMDKIIRVRFKDSFDQVVDNFEAVFRELYGGGHANIILTDKDDPLNSEIEITAQPPGKQLKHINLMSGGEKTMTAIALMFAVLKTKPTPCCILDEIEAALDDNNLQIFGRYIKQFPGVQFTLITHQKATMEHADVMYGITMPESGVSRVYSLKMEGAEGDMENAG